MPKHTNLEKPTSLLPCWTFPSKITTGKSGHETLWDFFTQLSAYRDETVCLDFSGVSFIEGNMSALLLVLAHRLRCEYGLRFLCEAGEGEGAQTLLERNGLYALLSESPVPVHTDVRQTTVQARLFEVEDDASFFQYVESDLLGHRCMDRLDGKLKEWLSAFFFMETFANIKIHANATLPFAVCGQYFPKKGKMYFSVCDIGNGFLDKIRRFTQAQGNPVTEPEAAIKWALTGGSTQRIRGGSALSGIFQQCCKHGHDLYITTDGVIWQYKNGKVQCRQLNAVTEGASLHIVFRNV